MNIAAFGISLVTRLWSLSLFLQLIALALILQMCEQETPSLLDFIMFFAPNP